LKHFITGSVDIPLYTISVPLSLKIDGMPPAFYLSTKLGEDQTGG
jgi:hypothetical protein